jgi:hypothetical protein
VAIRITTDDKYNAAPDNSHCSLITLRSTKTKLSNEVIFIATVTGSDIKQNKLNLSTL